VEQIFDSAARLSDSKLNHFATCLLLVVSFAFVQREYVSTRRVAVALIAGVPHLIKDLEALLDYVVGHDGGALMTGSEMGN